MERAKPNILDNLFAILSPEMALKRLVARQKLNYFRYEGAQSSRARGMPGRLESPESSAQASDRISLMKEARDLAENDPFVKGLLLMMRNYVCGSLRYQALTGDPKINQIYEDYLNDWFQNCDITGRHTFEQLMQICLISIIRDGDVGINMVVDKETKNMWLQGIEGDRIGNPYETSAINSKYVSGILLDGNGRPLKYQIFKRSKENNYSDPREVKAENFIHFFDPMRLDEYRGRTAFHAAITTFRDIHDILDAERRALKFASYQTAVVRTASGASENSTSYFDTDTDKNNNTIHLEAIEQGKVNYVGPAEDLKMFESNRPSPAFQGMLQMLYRLCCTSIDIPYGFAYDMSIFGGPTARFESAKAARAFARYQRLLEMQGMNRIKNRKLALGIEAGDIPVHKSFTRGKWMYPAHTSIDVGRESKANLEENRQGAKSLSSIYSEQNQDWEEELEQIASEAAKINELAKKYKVQPQEIRLLTPNGNMIVEKEEKEEKPSPKE